MIRVLSTLLLVIPSFLTWTSHVHGADPKPLHRTVAANPAELRALFQYDGEHLPLVSAHRGGAIPGYPENCLETFEHTLQHTFSMLEIDLQYSKDGDIVLHHDSTLDRTTSGTGPVSDYTVAELKQLRLRDSEGNLTDYHMPTLDEALEWARGKTIVVLDKKKVPVDVCVRKIQEHHAQSYAMVMGNSVDDVRRCYELDPDIMLEAMAGEESRVAALDKTNVPWDRLIAFVGHDAPKNKDLIKQIHDRGTSCMAGTSRNLDREILHVDPARLNTFEEQYQSRLRFGIDLIETDLPISTARLLYPQREIPTSKARFFRVE